MATYIFDTAEAIDEMVEAGLDRQHARVIVRHIAQMHETLATKSDIQQLETAIGKSAIDLKYFVLKTVIGTGAGLFIALKASQYLGF